VTEPLSVDQVRELRELAGRIVSSPPGTWFASDTLALARGVAQLAAEWEARGERIEELERQANRDSASLDWYASRLGEANSRIEQLAIAALAVSSSAPTTKETE
jgi:hypothetical protein